MAWALTAAVVIEKLPVKLALTVGKSRLAAAQSLKASKVVVDAPFMVVTATVWEVPGAPKATTFWDEFAGLVVQHAPTRLLWGSDWPHPQYFKPMPNDVRLLDQMLDWVPDEKTRKLIFVDNPAEAFGFRGIPGPDALNEGQRVLPPGLELRIPH